MKLAWKGMQVVDDITERLGLNPGVAFEETGDHDWLAFSMSDDDKIDLFQRGVVAAVEFLNGFDWAEYKKVRAALLAMK